MTSKELKTLLESTGLPVDYDEFSKGRGLPVIVYYSGGTSNVGADGGVYYKNPVYVIELYTEDEGEAEIEKLEAVLDSANVFYNRSQDHIKSQSFWMTVYDNLNL